MRKLDGEGSNDEAAMNEEMATRVALARIDLIRRSWRRRTNVRTTFFRPANRRLQGRHA